MMKLPPPKPRKGGKAKPTQPHRDRTKYRRKEKHRDDKLRCVWG